MSESQLKSKTSWVPLSYCVRVVQMDLDSYESNQYEKLLQYAILGYQDLNFTTMNSVKVAYLEMSDINVITLPSDFDSYYKIGMPINGKLWNLGLNNKILLPRDEDCGNDVRDVSNSSDSPANGYFYTPHYRGSEYVGGLFGIGGGFRESHYRIDTARNQIIFDSIVPGGEIVLEYKSNGISPQTMVPRRAINVVVAYIHWRRLKGKRREAERREAEREWKEEVSQLRALNMRFNPTEYLDMLRSNMVATPKR